MATTVDRLAETMDGMQCPTFLTKALVTSPMQFLVAMHYRDIAGLRYRESAETMARCEGTVSWRPHDGRRR